MEYIKNVIGIIGRSYGAIYYHKFILLQTERSYRAVIKELTIHYTWLH